MGMIERGGTVTLLVIVLWLLLAKGLPSILESHEKNIATIIKHNSEQVSTYQSMHKDRTELEERRHTDHKECLTKIELALIDAGIAVDNQRPVGRAIISRLNKD